MNGKRLVLHALGISAVVAAFSIELLMLYDIAMQGYFLAIEPNPVILTTEILLAIFGLLYFLVITIKGKVKK